jgi:uncharacterized protein (TIGR03382 family)
MPLLLVLPLLLPSAHAFTIQTVGDTGCHEAITQDALRRVRDDAPSLVPGSTSDEDRAIIDDVPFELDDDLHDIAAVALVLGARENDLGGRTPYDVSRLAALHGDSDHQREHCLRDSEEDEPDGSTDAIADCRAYILETIDTARTGLDADGAPDLDVRDEWTISLDYRGLVDIPLPVFWFDMGRALHALEDGYTHTYRADSGEITAVLNFVDLAENDYEEGTDGPSHLSPMDDCNADAYRTARADTAQDAAYDLLTAVVEDGGDPESVLDERLAFLDGCDASNDWCNAAERQFSDTGCSTSGGAAAPLLVLAGLLATFRRRAVVLGALLLPRLAAAKPVTKNLMPTGFEFDVAVALDRPALAPTFGVLYRHNERWVFGGAAQWNPWFSYTTLSGELGTANVFAIARREFQMKAEQVRVTVTAELGASVLLFDLYGAPAGSVGPYVALSPLGIEWKLKKHGYFVFEPGIALPVPRIVGIPFSYYQYRINMGVRWGA